MNLYIRRCILILTCLSLSPSLRGAGCCDISNPLSCSTSVSCNTACTETCTRHCGPCRTIVIGRSTHANSSFFGLTPYLYEPNETECNGGFVAGYELLQTFDGCALAQAIAGTPNILFQGSRVANRSANALIADYFGLSQTFNGSLTLDPQIENNSLQMQLYFGWDGLVRGLYLTIDFTFTSQTRRLFKLGCGVTCEPQSSGAQTAFPPAYMGTSSVTPIDTMFAALKGVCFFGDMQTPWSAGRWSSCPLNDHKVAGISLNLGYNPILCDDYHFGFFVRYTAPTGTRIDGSQKWGDYFFFPIIGNAHHHELGGGLHAHATLWSNDCDNTFTAFFDGYATHMFSDQQWRSFDFKERGCFSRYMLLKKMTLASTTDPFDLTNARLYDYVGAKGLVNGINVATRLVHASFAVQGEASLRFIYQHRDLSCALGYTAYGRSAEKICLPPYPPCDSSSTQLYGFKGCQGAYAYVYGVTGGNVSSAGSSTPLNATSSQSTARSCMPADAPVAMLTNTAVGVAWNNVYPADGGNGATADTVTLTTPVANLVKANESQPAQVITAADIDVWSGAVPRMFTNRGFFQLDYVWHCVFMEPSVGFGLEVEGGTCASDLRQWGFWVRGGCSW